MKREEQAREGTHCNGGKEGETLPRTAVFMLNPSTSFAAVPITRSVVACACQAVGSPMAGPRCVIFSARYQKERDFGRKLSILSNGYYHKAI